VNDDDQPTLRFMRGLGGPPEPIWPYSDSPATESQPSGYVTELVSVSYVLAALRRGARLLCVLAIIGLVLGLGYKVERPTPYEASTTLLIPGDEASNGAAILTDVALAQSRAVAALALQKLALAMSPQAFVSTYTVANLTDDVLVITTSARTASGALQEANVLASSFLKFRDSLQIAEQKAATGSVAEQAKQATRQVQSLNNEIRDVSAGPASSARTALLTGLQTRLNQANTALTDSNSSIRTIQQQTAVQIKESTVLDPAAVIPKSRKKPVLLGAALGLFGGLIMGMAILAVRAVASNRLRRRDDVAHALGAPVKLSVGPIRRARWKPGRPNRVAPTCRDAKRVIRQLREAAFRGSGASASLAIVAVDKVEAAALCAASLASSCAQEGMNVVLADLTRGASAGRLLGARRPGVVATDDQGARLTVSVADPADPAPLGPRQTSDITTNRGVSKEFAEACSEADLLLVLTALDPALGGDHLATWADDAVVMITAGRSSWARIHAAGEMVRLARLRLHSAVLIGADKTDDSIGLVHEPRADRATGMPRHRLADLPDA